MGEINWKNKCWVTTAYLVRDDGKILLSWNKQMHDWIPVGGHMEPGETPEEAIRREVKEETGFDFEFLEEDSLENNGDIRIIKPYRVQIEKVPHHNFHIDFAFIGKCTKYFEKETTDENEKLRWFSEDEIKAMKGKMIESVYNLSLTAIKLVKEKLEG